MLPRSYIKKGKAHMSGNEVFARWLLLLTVFLIIAASAMAWGETGLRKGEHSTPVPQGVTMLTPDIYLIADDAKITASELCKFGGVSRNARAKGLNADLAVCYDNQTWNVDKGPAQSTIPDGVTHAVKQPWVWIASGIIVFLAFPWTYLMALWIIRKERKALAKINKARAHHARELLIAQWTKSDRLDLDDPGYISQADFENRLGQLDEAIRTGKPLSSR